MLNRHLFPIVLHLGSFRKPLPQTLVLWEGATIPDGFQIVGGDVTKGTFLERIGGMDTAEAMDCSEKVRRFRAIARHFKSRYRDMELMGEYPYRLTCLGAWAASRPHHLFYFFSRLELGQYRLFIDLGSGDGIAACIAGLFTRAVGIEVDSGLCRVASEATRILGLLGRVDFVCGDYRSQVIQRADCLYIYPEKPLDSLLTILRDWQGTLLVYGTHYPPTGLPPACSVSCGRERITVYQMNRSVMSASCGLFP